jgi:hypothetical protein
MGRVRTIALWVVSPVIVLAVAVLGASLSWWLFVRVLQAADQPAVLYLGSFVVQGLVVGVATMLLTKGEREHLETIAVAHLRQSILLYVFELSQLYNWFTVGGWRIFIRPSSTAA